MLAANAYPSGHLVPSPFLGLACAPIVETRFLDLAMSLLDFNLEYPLVVPRFCFPPTKLSHFAFWWLSVLTRCLVHKMVTDLIIYWSLLMMYKADCLVITKRRLFGWKKNPDKSRIYNLKIFNFHNNCYVCFVSRGAKNLPARWRKTEKILLWPNASSSTLHL